MVSSFFPSYPGQIFLQVLVAYPRRQAVHIGPPQNPCMISEKQSQTEHLILKKGNISQFLIDIIVGACKSRIVVTPLASLNPQSYTYG